VEHHSPNETAETQDQPLFFPTKTVSHFGPYLALSLLPGICLALNHLYGREMFMILKVRSGILWSGVWMLVTAACTKAAPSSSSVKDLPSSVTIPALANTLICPSQVEFSLIDVSSHSFIKAAQVTGLRMDSAPFRIDLTKKEAHDLEISNPFQKIVALEAKDKETQLALPATLKVTLGKLEGNSSSGFRSVSFRMPLALPNDKTTTLAWEGTWDSADPSFGLSSGSVDVLAQGVSFRSAFIDAKECDADAFQSEQPGMLVGSEKIGPKKTRPNEFVHVSRKGDIKIAWKGRTAFGIGGTIDKTVLTGLDEIQITGLTSEPIKISDAKQGAFHLPTHHNTADVYIIHFAKLRLSEVVTNELKNKNIHFLRLRKPFLQDELDKHGINRFDPSFGTTYLIETLNSEGSQVNVLDVSQAKCVNPNGAMCWEVAF